jgi:hypothetical protein
VPIYTVDGALFCFGTAKCWTVCFAALQHCASVSAINDTPTVRWFLSLPCSTACFFSCCSRRVQTGQQLRYLEASVAGRRPFFAGAPWWCAPEKLDVARLRCRRCAAAWQLSLRSSRSPLMQVTSPLECSSGSVALPLYRHRSRRAGLAGSAREGCFGDCLSWGRCWSCCKRSYCVLRQIGCCARGATDPMLS